MKRSLLWLLALSVGVASGVSCADTRARSDEGVGCVPIASINHGWQTLWRCDDGETSCYLTVNGGVSCVRRESSNG
jgi:hypothetical protein